jgi:perosamine synthetase
MIPIIKPHIAFDDVADDIRTVLESGMLTRGPYVGRFETMVRDYVGVRHAFATTSATTALHLALVAAGIGAGDEVLVSDFTFPASGNVIVEAGATPVLVDCLPGSFAIDLADAGRKLTPKSKSLMVVDPFGQPVDFAAVEAFAERHDLFLVEDAACALGATRNGRSSGSLRGAGCFSFHPRKIITTGEGGAITTNDDRLAERIQVLRNHGGEAGPNGIQFTANGFNYRMSEIQAVLGIAQMRDVEKIFADRRRTARLYLEALRGVNGLSIPLTSTPDECTFQSFVVLLDDHIDRDQIIKDMRVKGIETTLGTYAMHAHPAFARFGYAAGDLPNSLRAQSQSLTLPLLQGMDPETIRIVADALLETMGTRSRGVASQVQ